MRINGNVFVVTGAGNGMGREVTLALIAKGARVAAVDVSQEGLEETSRRSADGRRITLHRVDITDRDAVEELASRVTADQGRVDGVVNIAGIIQRFTRVTELTPDEMQRVMNVNFWGTVNITYAFLPHLMARPAASLTNMSSLSALIPFAGQTFYGASKGAVKQFTEGLYQELRRSNVQIGTIFPGNTRTDIGKNSGVNLPGSGGRELKGTSARKAGAIIVKGIERGRFRILTGSDAWVLDKLVRLAPRWATGVLAKPLLAFLDEK